MSVPFLHRVRRGVGRLLDRCLVVTAPRNLAPMVRQLKEHDVLARDRARWDATCKMARLRLYAHALDKGLHMDVFDPDRGHAALRACEDLLADPDVDRAPEDPTLAWCREKVEQYRSRRTAVAAGRDSGPLGRGPSDGAAAGEPTGEALRKLFENRRSCRAFLDRPVSDETVRGLADAARWAPSSCNRQAVRIFATNDPVLAAACHATCRGCSCFGERIPAFAAFCIDVRAYVHPQEFTVGYVDGGLALQNFLVAAHAAGLGATPMAVGAETAEQRARLRALLRIPACYAPTVHCTFGYPARWAEPAPRKPVDSMLALVRRSQTPEDE